MLTNKKYYDKICEHVLKVVRVHIVIKLTMRKAKSQTLK